MMKKELPKVYANAIDKEIKNNERVSYSKSEERDVKEDVKLSKSDILKNELKGNINQKINNIFNAQNYIYKADVVITFKDKKVNKRIVGRNGNHLITYDNELIPISDIVDINYK
mgnify:CR=1 FL=1